MPLRLSVGPCVSLGSASGGGVGGATLASAVAFSLLSAATAAVKQRFRFAQRLAPEGCVDVAGTVPERSADRREPLAPEPAVAHALRHGPAVGPELAAADILVPAFVVVHEQAHGIGPAVELARVETPARRARRARDLAGRDRARGDCGRSAGHALRSATCRLSAWLSPPAASAPPAWVQVRQTWLREWDWPQGLSKEAIQGRATYSIAASPPTRLQLTCVPLQDTLRSPQAARSVISGATCKFGPKFGTLGLGVCGP